MPALRSGAGNRTRKVQTAPIPPPVGGWNARDPLSSMGPTDAIRMDNFTPLEGSIETRPGMGSFATGVSGLYTETLMTYRSPSTTKMFAAATDTIWDVTSAGAASSSLTGLDNGRWQHANLVNAGNAYLLCVNDSVDGLRYYNGSGWSTATLTGAVGEEIDDEQLANIAVHQNRVWLLQHGSLDVWYLDTGAVTGTASRLLTSTQFTRGGYAMAAASWTRDGGSGMDDVFALISSEGEVLIYSGTDPDSADTWAKVGLFHIPRPIGRRCVIKYGGDLAILTYQGLIPMSEVLQRADANQAITALTDKISGAFSEAAQLYGDNHGWQVIEYPRRSLIIINVPTVERSTALQFVVNTRTGAWARWTDLDANCWGRQGDSLYFGLNDGTVFIFDDAQNDNGDPIDGLCISAYNAFSDPRRKRFVRVQPLMQRPDGYKPLVDILLNYTPVIPDYSPPVAVTTGWVWDVTAWDDLTWSSDLSATFDWIAVRGHGVAAAVAIAVSTDAPITYNGGLIAYESGGIY